MRVKLLATAAAACLLMSQAASAANLVTNGDFSAGNSGFGSDYTYVPSAPNAAWDAATYAIDTNPRNVHDLWSSFGDHTSGTGNMMIVNGSLTSGDWVWLESGLSVLPNTTYYFSTWVAATYPDSPALLDFSINGQAIGPTFTVDSPPGAWTQFFASWNSGSNTVANLALVNRNTTYGGNDFALDDIAFDTLRPGAAVPEPATWALMISGFGAAGAMLRRRRALAA